jgi:hypothetical protein
VSELRIIKLDSDLLKLGLSRHKENNRIFTLPSEAAKGEKSMLI